MDTASQSPAVPMKKPYRVPRIGLAAWLVVASVLGVARYIVDVRAASGSIGSYSLAHIIGSQVGILIQMILVSAAVFFLSRRSHRIATVASILVLGLNGIHMTMRLMDDVHNLEVTQSIKQVVQETSSSVKGVDGTSDEVGGAARLTKAENGLAKLQELSGSLRGDGGGLGAATAEFMGQIQAASTEYVEAMKALAGARILDASTLTSVTQIQGRREVVRRFRAANGKMRSLLLEGESMMMAELARSGVAQPLADTALRSFRDARGPLPAVAAQYFEIEDQLGQSFIAALDLLEQHWGLWKFDSQSGQLIIPDETTLSQYDVLMARIASLAEQEAQLRPQMAI